MCGKRTNYLQCRGLYTAQIPLDAIESFLYPLFEDHDLGSEGIWIWDDVGSYILFFSPDLHDSWRYA